MRKICKGYNAEASILHLTHGLIASKMLEYRALPSRQSMPLGRV